MGVMMFQQGKCPEAIKFLGEALKTPSNCNRNLLLSSKIYLQIFAHLRDSKGYFEGSLKKAYYESYLLYAFSAIRAGDFNKALACSQIMLEKDLGDREPFLFMASHSAYRLGQFSDAVVFLKEFLLTQPHDVQAQQMLVLCLKGAGKVEEAQMISDEIAKFKSRPTSYIIKMAKIDVRMF